MPHCEACRRVREEVREDEGRGWDVDGREEAMVPVGLPHAEPNLHKAVPNGRTRRTVPLCWKGLKNGWLRAGPTKSTMEWARS